MYDLKLDIATAPTCEAAKWRNDKTTWGKLVDTLANPIRTRETLKEYQSFTKEAQGRIKDVGGYFGGYLRGGKRSPRNVVFRQLVTLDIDYGHVDTWFDFTNLFTCAAVLHSTHSHTPENPRYRLIIPLDREAAPDEFLAASRKIAGVLGIEYFDNTTFDLNRLMFWPSVSKDAKYYFKEQKGEPLSLDEVLAMYVYWQDVSAWPTNKALKERPGTEAEKQQDPTTKKGIIGAFCRTYSIEEAIEKFLEKEYEPGTEGRYTYLKGSTSNGLVIYDGKFAYSHHNTDPAGGLLCNAFDLVRLHKFGSLDASPNSNKSFTAMEDFAREDKETKKTIARELLESAAADFEGLAPTKPRKNKDKPAKAKKPREEDDLGEEEEDDPTEWMAELETDRKGAYLPTASNINAILRNDALIGRAFALNEFDGKRYVTRSLPWRTVRRPEAFEDVDFAGVRNYIECVYGIANSGKIDDALALVSYENSYHPIVDYLEPLKWDGVPRVENLLIDYFGVEDSPYVRKVTRMTLTAAITRAFEPGCKYDYMLVLVGTQGEAKSQLLKRLARGWFSDSFQTVHGKEAFEQLQGVWIMEVAELSAFRKAEVESIKHFLSKQSDHYRAAYGRALKEYKRQCIFIGTTNRDEFLKDATGNRRFLPVKTRKQFRTKSTFDDLTKKEVDQIWAEAMELYRAGEPIYLSGKDEKLANEQQSAHFEYDERVGLVEAYLNTLLPKNWPKLGLSERIMYLETNDKSEGDERDYVCIAEIWCECFGRDRREMSRYNTRELNELMRSLPGWEAKNSTRNFPIYGKQKYFERKLF